MNFHAVIDTSAFIWDRKAYAQNAEPFFILASQLMTFIEIFEVEKPKIYLRKPLLHEMINGFPCDIETNIPNFFDLSATIYHFLSQLGDEIIEFEVNVLNGIYSKPDIILTHYNNTVRNELIYLISKIHNTQISVVYCTFEAIWDKANSLSTHDNSIAKKYETIVHPSNDQLRTFFNKYKPLFEPHPKHDRIKGKRKVEGKIVSPLSCFDGHDYSTPQHLLSTALKYGNKYYNYDSQNNTFVTFVQGSENKYHGHDEQIGNVPQEVKKRFHKK